MGHMIENKITTVTEIDTFMNKPILVIYEVVDGKKAEKNTIQFGAKKAKAILASIEAIKKFVEESK